jgi:hypothetical protein
MLETPRLTHLVRRSFTAGDQGFESASSTGESAKPSVPPEALQPEISLETILLPFDPGGGCPSSRAARRMCICTFLAGRT